MNGSPGRTRGARRATPVPPAGHHDAARHEEARRLRGARRHERCRAARRAALRAGSVAMRSRGRRRPGIGRGRRRPEKAGLNLRAQRRPAMLCCIAPGMGQGGVLQRRCEGAVHLGAGRVLVCASSTLEYLAAPPAHPGELRARIRKCRTALDGVVGSRPRRPSTSPGPAARRGGARSLALPQAA